MLAATTSIEDVLGDLDRDGCAVVEGMLSLEDLESARQELRGILASTPSGRNPFEGARTKRVYALFRKTRTMDRAAVDPLVLGVLDEVLGDYQLSGPTGIEIGPGEAAQVLHYDDAIYPVLRPHPELVLNTMWALDDFTVENGATRIIRGSHKWVDQRPGPDAETEPAEMEAGSVLFYIGSLWHGGGANQTESPRLGVVLEYAVSWVRQQENHVLAVPPDVMKELPERLQELLGYSIRPPFIGYVDGRHPRRLLERE